MNIFYSENVQGNAAFLDGTESYHCIRVLRQKKGDKVCIVDGKGGYYEGIISVPDHETCVISIINAIGEYGKRDYSLHVAIAPTKNIERFEWFLEKATEIGIDEITPLICSRSERRVLREDRLQRVITSAVKQSVKAYHPKLNSLAEFGRFVGSDFHGGKLIAHCSSSVSNELIKMDTGMRDFIILIGPEGDFSDEEVEKAKISGFLPVSLGRSRLRTETAGIVACQIIADLMALK